MKSYVAPNRPMIGNDAPDSLAAHSVYFGQAGWPDDPQRSAQSNGGDCFGGEFRLHPSCDAGTLDHLPRCSVDDVMDCRLGYSVSLRQSLLGGFAGCIGLEDHGGCTISKLGVRPVLAYRDSMFAHSIRAIPLGGRQEKMIWSDTCPHVTSVANEGSRGNGAVGQGVAEAMRRHANRCSTDSQSIGKGPVASSLEFAANPQPTRCRFVNHLPEPFSQRLTPIMTGDKSTSSRRTPSATTFASHNGSIS